MSPQPAEPRLLQHWMRWYRRDDLDISFDELSARTGLSKVFLQKVERGERNASPASKALIADALHASVDDIFRPARARKPVDIVRRWNEHRRGEADDDGEAPSQVDAELVEAYYEQQDPATHKLLKLQLVDGRPLIERPPKWFREQKRRSRT